MRVREMVLNERDRPCRCGNTIRAGQLMEIINVRHGKRCLGCHLKYKSLWTWRPRRISMPYELALEQYHELGGKNNVRPL